MPTAATDLWGATACIPVTLVLVVLLAPPEHR